MQKKRLPTGASKYGVGDLGGDRVVREFRNGVRQQFHGPGSFKMPNVELPEIDKVIVPNRTEFFERGSSGNQKAHVSAVLDSPSQETHQAQQITTLAGKCGLQALELIKAQENSVILPNLLELSEPLSASLEGRS